MQKHKLRDVLKHCIASETTDPHNNMIKRTCLVRQFHFKRKNNKISKNDPTPADTRTRRVAVELMKINGIKHIVSTCDCCYAKRECHSCRHEQCTLDLLPTSDFFYPKCWKSCFHFMFQTEDYTRMVKDYDALFSLCPGLTMKMNSSCR